MSGFSAIELSKLPAPDIVESLDYEIILSQMKADLSARDPNLADTLTLESEPLTKLLEVCAYRELILRQRVNDASKSVMLAYATGADLDNLAAFFGVSRQEITPAVPEVIPPVKAVYEDDERFRHRVQLSLEGHSTAGPVGSYIYWGLSASPDVKDIDIQSENPGQVQVTVLSRNGDGTPSHALLDTVAEVLNSDDVRPLTDEVIVIPANIQAYSIDASLVFYEGPDHEVVRQAAEQAVKDFVTAHHRLGNSIPLSGIYAALHQPGVHRVNLQSPASDIVVLSTEAAYCDVDNNIRLANGGQID